MYEPGTEQINCNGRLIELPTLEVVRPGEENSSPFDSSAHFSLSCVLRPSISSQNAQRCQHWLVASHLFHSPRIHALPPTHRTWAESAFESRVPVLCPGEMTKNKEHCGRLWWLMLGVFSNWWPSPGSNWPWRGQPHWGAQTFAKISGAQFEEYRDLQGNRPNTVGNFVYIIAKFTHLHFKHLIIYSLEGWIIIVLLFFGELSMDLKDFINNQVSWLINHNQRRYFN